MAESSFERSVRDHLGRIEAKLDIVINVVEVEKHGNAEADERIIRLQGVAKNLTYASMRIATARVLPHWGTAIAIGIASALVTVVAMARVFH